MYVCVVAAGILPIVVRYDWKTCVCVVTAGILPIVEEEEAEAEEDEGLTTILENEEEGWCGCVYCTWLYMEL